MNNAEILPKINELSDYPAIKKLAAALHQFEANKHGAAIIVGAGFSRCAARHVSGEKKMPLWGDFTKKLLAELNPNITDLYFSDPLRVAEEYRAYFGKAALNDIIRSEIDDDALIPTGLCQSLLKLPWSEVMTTNWDTLLERAAKDIHHPYYSIVTKPTDLTWALSPRIVKLHGTIGITNTFIAAQEDYRTYPEKFAPFVNFVRQVFIEHELCLLGFSGDDPNFLHWAGWVRDHLAGHSRKIYLVGALNLTPARRKHLESMNISPIDLWDAVQHIDDVDLRHQTATELFLHKMEEEGLSKVMPHQWKPDFPKKAACQKELLKLLKQERESYPQWLVCPPAFQLPIQLELRQFNLQSINSLESTEQAEFLYEIAWRYGITFEYIPHWVADRLFKISNPDVSCGLSKRQQLEITLLLLKNSRWLVSDNENSIQEIQKYNELLTSILEKYAEYLPNCTAELAYHQAIVARDEFDYARMEMLIEKIVGEDPVWKFRQAALLMELGRFDEGKKLIALAYGELRVSHQKDRYSVSVMSHFCWAYYLFKATKINESEPLPNFIINKYQEWKCDPLTWIEFIQNKVNEHQEKYLKNQNSIVPLFNQGSYQNNSNNFSFSNETSVFLILEGLSRNIGIPLRSGSPSMTVNLLASNAEKLVVSNDIGIDILNYILAIRAANADNSPSIKDVFTRIGISQISQEVILILVSRILPAISYWKQKRSNGTTDQKVHALSAIRVLMAVLARLVVRVSSAKAKDVFKLAVSIGKQTNLQHFWLTDVLDSLLTNSLKSIPESKHEELLEEALSFPLPSEANILNSNWSNPVIRTLSSPRQHNNSNISKRINELIEAVYPEYLLESDSGQLPPLCKESLERLLHLHINNYLTLEESEKLAQRIWGNKTNQQQLPVTGLLPHALLLLPAKDKDHVEKMLSHDLYESTSESLSLPSELILSGMANAAADERTQLFPKVEQAVKLFNLLVQWRPQEINNDFLGVNENNRKQLVRVIGDALFYAIMPMLSDEIKTIELFEKLNLFHKEVEESIPVIPAFVYFAHLEQNSTIEKIIRKALQSTDGNEVYYAAISLKKWAELSENTNSLQLNKLISRLIVIIESGRTTGLQHLLWIAGELLENKQLLPEQIEILIDAVPNAFRAASYTNIEPNSKEAITASSIREACVKLTHKLVVQFPNNSDLQALLEEAKNDPLPEVRFAVE